MIFREPMSYMDTILLNVPPYQVVSRIMVVGIFNVTGILMALFVLKRKKAEETVREQRDFLNTLLEAIPNPVYYKMRNGQYSGCNSAFENFVGKPRDSIIGKTAFDLVKRKDIAEQYAQQDKKLLETPGVQHYESMARRSDGLMRHIVFNKAPLLNKNGKVEGIIGIISDITELKKMEEDKVRLEKSLLQSQKLETIGTLAGGIAHDFNNILYGTIGYTELCLDDTEPGTLLHQNLCEVMSGEKRAKALVKQILTFSRQTEKEIRPTQMAAIVQEVSKLLRSTIPPTINIVVDIEAHASTILGDPTEIHQVIMNLCTNAVHAMEERGGTLKMEIQNTLTNPQSNAGATSNDGAYLKLSVSDTGCGIPEEIQDRIFDPFFTTKEQGKGTGMGLSMVHGIVQSHDGHIEISQSSVEGTTFDIYLPLAENPDIPLEIASHDDIPGAGQTDPPFCL